MSRTGLRVVEDVHRPYIEAAREQGGSVLAEYARDPFKLADDGLVYIEDLETGLPIKFRPYDHERDVLAGWIDLDHLRETGTPRFRNEHIEKSRRMGISWTLAYGALWALCFHPVTGLMMARRANDVDDGGEGSTTASFFGRMRFMATHEAFPVYLRESLVFTYHLIRNSLHPDAYIRGESANPNPGRGLRLDFGILDEAARIERGESVHSSLSQACPNGRVYNSTPHGRLNVYHRLRSPRLPGYEYLRLHWSQHPVFGAGQHLAGAEPTTCQLCAGNAEGLDWTPEDTKAHRYPGKLTSPWYDRAIIELTDDQVAMELDIDYAGSLTARVFPEFSREVHVADRPIAFDPLLRIGDGWDYGFSPSFTSVVAFQETPRELRVIGEFEARGLTPDEVAAGYRQVLARKGVPEKLLVPKWTLRHESIGDPAGEAREIGSGRSVASQYRKEGFAIQSKAYPISSTITALKRLLRGIPKRLVVSPDCTLFITHIEESRWPTNRDGVAKPNASQPVNDEHWHMVSAFRYAMCFKFPPPDTEELLDATLDRGRPVADERGLHDPSIRYGMKLARANHRRGRDTALNADRGRAHVSGLRRAEEVACFDSLPFLRSET